jgi:hypothetical protein
VVNRSILQQQVAVAQSHRVGARRDLAGPCLTVVLAGLSVKCGRVVGASSTSCGISTHAGPSGGVAADSQAYRSTVGSWLAVRTGCTDLTTSRKLARWSVSSCR